MKNQETPLKQYHIRFMDLVGVRHTWQRYSKTMEQALESAKTAIRREYPDGVVSIEICGEQEKGVYCF